MHLLGLKKEWAQDVFTIIKKQTLTTSFVFLLNIDLLSCLTHNDVNDDWKS